MQREQTRVLVVDDNQDAADSLAVLLSLMGYQSMTAYDGNAALSMAQTQEPDAMVIDISLPGMNGVALAEALRKQPFGGRISLIALTGFDSISDTVYPATNVFDQCLVKPVDKTALEAMCRTIDEKKKAR